jgi:hypothetical protein
MCLHVNSAVIKFEVLMAAKILPDFNTVQSGRWVTSFRKNIEEIDGFEILTEL